MVEKVSKKTKGGARPGSGRKKGSPNKKTAALVQAVEASGITPLDFMLDIMRGKPPKDSDPASCIAFASMQFEAAKAAAPYVHAKLQPVDGKTGSTEVRAKVTVEFVSPSTA